MPSSHHADTNIDITDSATWPVAMDVDEVAAVLRVERKTVLNRIREGKLPAYQTGRTWRVERSELLAVLKGHRTKDDDTD